MTLLTLTEFHQLISFSVSSPEKNQRFCFISISCQRCWRRFSVTSTTSASLQLCNVTSSFSTSFHRDVIVFTVTSTWRRRCSLHLNVSDITFKSLAKPQHFRFGLNRFRFTTVLSEWRQHLHRYPHDPHPSVWRQYHPLQLTLNVFHLISSTRISYQDLNPTRPSSKKRRKGFSLTPLSSAWSDLRIH